MTIDPFDCWSITIWPDGTITKTELLPDDKADREPLTLTYNYAHGPWRLVYDVKHTDGEWYMVTESRQLGATHWDWQHWMPLRMVRL